jgi:hypothetical protein
LKSVGEVIYVSAETWDEPVKCAEFIERFTSHNLSDVDSFNLRDYSRSDLEGIIELLHGLYTHFMLDSPVGLREDIRCRVEDVLLSMAIASSMQEGEGGELVLSDEVWDIVKNSPQLLTMLLRYETS